MGPEEKCRDYKDAITEEFPCFEMWFNVEHGKILDFEEDNHGVGVINGLPLSVVFDVVDAVKEEVEGNVYEIIPTDGKHILTVKIREIEYFGGQWSDDALAWEIAPAYWFCVELISAKNWQEIINERTPPLF